MKLNKWLYGAAALAMLAACSDKDVAPGGDNLNKGEITFSEGISYLGITIQLPDEQNTRAGDDNYQGNDRFDDGLPAEYNVDNAAVLLFYGPDEESSLFVGAYTLVDDEVIDKPGGDNITTSIKRTIQVKNKPEETANYKLWALALVNFDANGENAHFKIESSVNNDNYGDLTLTNAYIDGEKGNKKLVRIGKGTDLTPVTKFSEIRELITDCDFREMKANNSNSVKHIFMTNAPLSNMKGTSQSPKVTDFAIQTLAELDYSKFKATQAEAQNEPAGCIFVERGLAKVTCGSFPVTVDLESTQVNLADGKSKSVKAKLTVESVSWAIDNEEQKTYLIRNTKTTDPWWGYKSAGYYNANADRWRFVGNADMNDHTYHDGQTPNHGWFRTYWCNDPNYSGDDKEYNYQAYDAEGNTKADAFTLFKNGTGDTKESEFPLYCHENTFSIANQNYKNTTRVVFKVKYSNTVKILKEGTTDEYEDKTNQNLFALRDQLTTFFLQEDAENLLMRAVISANQMDELLEAYRTDTGNITFTKDDFSYELTVATEDDDTRGITKGDWIFASLDFKTAFYEAHLNVDETKKAEIREKLTQIMQTAESTYHIVPFTNNECYYAVYIKHFGDSYCKLPYEVKDGNEIETWKGVTTETVYGTDNATFDASQKYLGRYGMVRNNWYDLNIDKITKIGKATVPDGNSDKSDDNIEEESFMSVRIHVLSWAKRTQHTTL